jgi:hypothetical protein
MQAAQDVQAAPMVPGSWGFVRVTITDVLTQMDNIYVSHVLDRGCPGFILFLPTMRQTLYICSANHVRALCKSLAEMRHVLRVYNVWYTQDGNASLIAFIIHLMENVYEPEDLHAVVNVQQIRERDFFYREK